MNEFTAALGIVGVERLDEITAWKNAIAREQLDPHPPEPVELPDGMVSGPLQVHRLRPDRAVDREGLRRALPPAARATTSTCRTATGSPRTTGASRCTTGRSDGPRSACPREGPRHGRVGLHRLACRRPADRRRPRAGRSSTSPPSAHHAADRGRVGASATSPTATPRGAQRAAATRSSISPRSPTSTTSSPTRFAPTGSTSTAPR